MVSTVYEGTQADDLGIQPGWTVCKVNDRYINLKEMDEVVSSGESFSITFQTQPQKEREVLFFRSRISSKVM